MADSEQVKTVLDAATQARSFAGHLSNALAASAVVELQRIADALEIIAAQGRHL